MSRKKLLTGLVLGGLAAAMFATQAEAVPSFARQTGLACAACHTVFPELTPFGRSFKLNGYTLTGIKQVEAKNTNAAAGLSVDQIPPLSAMLQVTATHSNNQTPSSQISLPDQLSFFFAGRISPHMGSFIQMTLEGAGGTFGMDNTDIRYANHSGAVTYGIDLNNNPTVEDLWNSTPAWGYPWTTGASIAQPVVAGALAQNVAGLGAYADWGNGLYTDVTLYKDMGAFGGPLGNPNVGISGEAPYWRVAYHTTMGNNELMVGTYGMITKLVNAGGASPYSGPADKYSDTAIDTQYEHNFANSNDMLSVHASYTHEKMTLDMTAPGFSPTLKSLRLNGTYHWGYHATATLAYANNKVDGAPAGIGLGNDKAWTAQLSYLPWQNTKFTLQYVKYSELAGQTGSAATDNNTTMVQGWFMW